MSHHPGLCLLFSRSRSGLPGRARGCPGGCPRPPDVLTRHSHVDSRSGHHQRSPGHRRRRQGSLVVVGDLVVLARGGAGGSNSPDIEAVPGQHVFPCCAATVARSSDRHLTAGLAVTDRQLASQIGSERNMSAPLTSAARRVRPESRSRTYPALWRARAVACPSDAGARTPASAVNPRNCGW
jgi:hypothetical protein